MKHVIELKTVVDIKSPDKNAAQSDREDEARRFAAEISKRITDEFHDEFHRAEKITISVEKDGYKASAEITSYKEDDKATPIFKDLSELNANDFEDDRQFVLEDDADDHRPVKIYTKDQVIVLIKRVKVLLRAIEKAADDHACTWPFELAKQNSKAAIDRLNKIIEGLSI